MQRTSKKYVLPIPLEAARLPQSNRAVSKCERCLNMIMHGCDLESSSCNSFCGVLGYIGTTCFCDVVSSSDLGHK